jgi:hypothetical protein
MRRFDDDWLNWRVDMRLVAWFSEALAIPGWKYASAS